MTKEFGYDLVMTTKTNFSIDELVSKLGTLGTQNILKIFNKIMIKSIKRRFETETTPEGRPWRSLSPVTIKRKRSRKKLQYTRKMMRAIKFLFVRNKLIISVDTEYAKVHQKGRRRKTVTKKQSLWMWANLFNKIGHPYRVKKMTTPARPFIGVSKKDLKEMDRQVLIYLKKQERLGRGTI